MGKSADRHAKGIELIRCRGAAAQTLGVSDILYVFKCTLRTHATSSHVALMLWHSNNFNPDSPVILHCSKSRDAQKSKRVLASAAQVERRVKRKREKGKGGGGGGVAHCSFISSYLQLTTQTFYYTRTKQPT